MTFLDELLRQAGLDGFNEPHDIERLGDIAKFCAIVEQGRQVWGGWCVSWGRSAERNAELASQGSHPQSLHQWGLGADVLFRSVAACAACWEFYQVAGLGGYMRDDGLSIHAQLWPHGIGTRPAPSHEVTR